VQGFNQRVTGKTILRMVPFTIFHRLSSLGSGGGVNAGTNPSSMQTRRRPDANRMQTSNAAIVLRHRGFSHP